MRLSTLTRDVTTDGTRMRWIGYVATILWWSGVVRSLTSLNRGHSYKISPKPCKISNSEDFGTCMFVWECIKTEGTHAGVCVDSFMFGSCCVHNNASSSSSPNDSSSSTSSSIANNRVKPHQQPQQFFYTGTTSLLHGNADRPSSSSSSSHAIVPGSSRPLQKRPQAKPSSEFHDYGPTMHQYSNNGWSKLPQNVGPRPLNRQPTTDSFDPGCHNSGFKDKIDDASTISTRLPGKNQGSEVHESLRTRPPAPVSWNVHTHGNDGQDQVAHETVYRPSYLHNQPDDRSTSTYRPVSPIDHERDHDERPNFVSRPETWKKPTKSRTTPKPVTYQSIHEDDHLSTSGGSAQTTHWRVTTEPAFVTKLSTTMSPNYPSIRTTTTSSVYPNVGNTASTGTSGSSGNKGDIGFWSEHSWTPTVDSIIKPHWTDVTSHKDTAPVKHQQHNRPSFESTESQQSTEYEKPSIGAAHYITTDDFGTALTRPRPTKRRKPSPGGTKSPGTSALVADRKKNRPTTEMTPSAGSSITTSDPITEIGLTSDETSKLPLKNSPTTTIAIPIEKTKSTIASTISSTTMTTRTTTTMRTTTTTASTMTTKTMKTTTVGSSATTQKILGSVPTVSAVGQGDKTECGVPSLFPRPETRIVGGKDAPFGRWPWQVSVRRTSFFGFSSTHRCGGAVLNANWIATAGHCVDDLLTSQIRIRVGDYDFSSVQERLPYVERGIAKKVVHPKYNFFTYEYDLALVRLESALVFAPHISPICLPATEDLLVGENATVTGWGRLSEGGTLPSVLQEVSVPIVSNDRCKSMFLRAGRHEFIPEIFLCAGYETGGHDSCQGDSGGPLQVRGKDGRYFLAGIISWGIGCAEANLPGVCTRISKFTSWILKNVT